ncbi:MAG: MauE/DoxX family redox-associated membrane protein [Flavipsychrobacter sp.]
MSIARRITLSLLSIAIGALFLFSAFTKIYDLESFEGFQYTIVEYVHVPWILATLGARILIGMEAALGLLMAIQFYGRKKWVLKLAIFLLIIFSVYLVYLWAAVGNNVDCGCFGDYLKMTPAVSILKNAALLIGIYLLIRFCNGIKFKRQEWITWILLIGLTIAPFIIYPLPNTQPDWLNKDKYKINLSSLYASGKTDAPKEDLYRGKHVIAFFSLKCPHCRMAAKKMHIMKEKNPSLPFYMVVAGNDKYMAPFFEDTHAQNIPYTKLNSEEFTAIAGFSWPAIFLVNNGMVEAQTNYINMNQAEIEDWLKKP